MTQLDLLEWKPRVRIVPFPTDRRVGKVRSFVDQYLSRKSDNGRLQLWQSALATLAQQMRRTGIDDDVITEQLEAFKSAVVNEIQRRSWQEQPGGAA